MLGSEHGYNPSINTKSFSNLNPVIKDMISQNNPTEFNYLSLSIRNHKMNVATSVPSNKHVVQDYLKNNLIEIDPLSSFERHTNKNIVTFYEIGKYKNHGKCGKTYLLKRRKSGLIHGFHYIHRHKNWSFTVVLGTDFERNGFATDEELITKNATWINSIVKKSLLIMDDKKEIILSNSISTNQIKFDKNINIIH